MANEEQLSLLRQGVESWNQWREENPDVEIDFSFANLETANLSEANLSGANLIRANLRYANLYRANLSEANLIEADLLNANLSNTNLSGADLYLAYCSNANLSYVDLNSANLRRADLSSAKLRNADLNHANLYRAILRRADLSNAILRNADLLLSQAVNTKFKNAELTGACIEDWNINSKTNFEAVKCSFIYRGYKDFKFTNRLPINPDQVFKPGEFEEWIRISAEAQTTIDLTFMDGIDWQSFFQSLQGVRQEYPDANVSLQAIEKKGSAFVIKLETSPDADQGAIESLTTELYETKLQLREAQGENRVLREMSDVLKQLAGKGIDKPKNITNIQANTIGVQHSGSGTITNFSQSTNRQTPAESAKEIQDLLIQLQSTNPADIQAVVEEQIKTDPSLKDRIRNALKEGGLEIMKVIFPLTGIAIETVRGWVEAESQE